MGSTVNLRGCILADTIYGQLYYLTPLAETLLLTTECRCMTLRSDAREQNVSLVRQSGKGDIGKKL